MDDLIELVMVDFDVIMGMDWIYSCFAKLDCRNRTVRFEFPNEPVIEWKGDDVVLNGRFISYLKTTRMINKGCIYHLVWVTYINAEAPTLESVPVVNEFPGVFPDELPGIPPDREIDFVIDIMLEKLTDVVKWMEYVTFLGHVISSEGIIVDPRKISVVKNWPKSTFPTEICSFLVLAVYYKKFVEEFSTLASPLTKLTQKASKFQWFDACERSFQELKSRLTLEPGPFVRVHSVRPVQLALQVSSGILVGHSAYGLHSEQPSFSASPTPICAPPIRSFYNGDSNGLATFMDLMNRVFKPYLGSFVIVFIDDILVYSHSGEEHKQHSWILLQTLKDRQLYAKFLNDGIKVDLKKIEGGHNYSRHTLAIEIRTFLGLAGYYRHFVEGFSSVAAPLTNLTQKCVPFRWSDECEESYRKLKVSLTTAPVLVLPTGKANVVVDTLSRKAERLAIAKWKWECITMDFLVGLPWTLKKFDAIWVIVDLLIKSAHFIPVMTTYALERLAQIYIREIGRLHGVSISIILDHGTHSHCTFGDP
ncbi:uncharacterized protein [Nicotiana tomentosiformis]|uniref:uncharacterized protein n=1 Tax=Nicotiana tomentosiformis TaxID=4098 RepID=UPI00388C7235